MKNIKLYLLIIFQIVLYKYIYNECLIYVYFDEMSMVGNIIKRGVNSFFRVESVIVIGDGRNSIFQRNFWIVFYFVYNFSIWCFYYKYKYLKVY